LTSQNRIYLDTSVFIFALDGIGLGHDKANKLLEDIAGGLARGVTSNFVKYEYRGHLKDSRATFGGTNASKAELDNLIQKLDELIDDYGIEEVSADYLLGDSWISDCEGIVDNSMPTSVRGGEWETIRGADGIHALIAVRANAQQLATLDNAFKGLKCVVQPLVLWDV